jgi:hypothetical protein
MSSFFSVRKARLSTNHHHRSIPSCCARRGQAKMESERIDKRVVDGIDCVAKTGRSRCRSFLSRRTGILLMARFVLFVGNNTHDDRYNDKTSTTTADVGRRRDHECGHPSTVTPVRARTTTALFEPFDLLVVVQCVAGRRYGHSGRFQFHAADTSYGLVRHHGQTDRKVAA